MLNLEPYTKKWYEYLKEGKIMGVRCKRCGGYEFPPVPICNSCSCTEMEWVEMSGEGELFSFAFSGMGVYPYTDEPVFCGYFKLDEGPEFVSWLLDADFKPAAQEVLLKQIPIRVKAEIKELDENVSWPVFRIVK